MPGVAPVPVGAATKYETEVSGSDVILARPPEATTGMTLVAAIRTNGSATAADYACAGFTHRGHPFIPNDAAGRVLSLFTHYISDIATEPASYTFTNAAATGRRVGVMQAFSGVDPTNPVAGNDPGWNAAGKPTIILNSFAVDSDNNHLLIYAWGNEVVSPNASAPTSVPGTQLALAASRSTTDATRSVLWLGYEPIAATTAGPESLTWASSSGESASGFVLRGLASAPVTTPKFTSVSQFLNTKGATAIHRAPAGYTQSCLDTLAKAAAAGFSAFEMSVGFSQDLKPFLSGYRYLDPLALNNPAGTTLDPWTMTWATISSTYQNTSGPTTQPLALLADALAATVDAGLGIAIVDPKYGFATPAQVSAMLDVCDAHGGPSKILIKFDNETTNTVLVNAAHARGYLAINYWGSDTSNLALQQGPWDVLGGLYSAGSTMWNALKSYGKKTWAAIVPDQAALNQAVIDTSADFYMVQSLAVTPVGPSAPDPSTYAGKTLSDLEAAWLRKVSGLTTGTISDLRRAVYTNGEHAYWASRSGLASGSLSDHKLATMKAATGATGTLTDVERIYYAQFGS